MHAFSEADVRYLVVGAYALAVHGHPRATGDLDVWVEPTPENAAKAYRGLAAFGAPLSELRVEDLHTEQTVFQIGIAPRRIDILTAISGVRFEDAWSRSIATTYEDVTFRVIGRNDLIVNKRAAGRPKDLVDADALEGSSTPKKNG